MSGTDVVHGVINNLGHAAAVPAGVQERAHGCFCWRWLGIVTLEITIAIMRCGESEALEGDFGLALERQPASASRYVGVL